MLSVLRIVVIGCISFGFLFCFTSWERNLPEFVGHYILLKCAKFRAARAPAIVWFLSLSWVENQGQDVVVGEWYACVSTVVYLEGLFPFKQPEGSITESL